MITPLDLVTRFGEDELKQVIKAEDLKAPLDQSDPKLLAACQDAEEIAATYLRQAYRLPFSSVPEVLTAYCADIARYRLHEDQSLDQKSLQRIRYDDALQWLEKVAAGKIKLFDSDNNTAVPESLFPLIKGTRVAVVSSPVVFTQATLEKMNAS